MFGEKNSTTPLEPVSKRVFNSGRPEVIEGDYEETRMTFTTEASRAFTWVYPLKIGDEVIGVIRIENTAYSTREGQDILPSFFDYMAQVLRNEIRNVNKLQAAYDRLAQLNTELEDRVRMRTVELEKTNSVLVGREAELQESVRQKEILLKEVHHRVKNNLQVIIAMLDLQLHQVERSIRPVLEEIKNRIRIFADIHRSLYQHRDVSRIDMRTHIEGNFVELQAIYGIDSTAIRLMLDIPDPYFELDYAIPCGLLVNELISNSMKHGNITEGEIHLTILRDTDGGIETLRYSDSGDGIHGDHEGFGTTVLRAMTRQLGLEYRQPQRKPLRFEFIRSARNGGTDVRNH